jgi:hypothetical protein
MFVLTLLLCAAGASAISGILLNFSSIGLGYSFLLSIVIVFLSCGALKAKEGVVKKQGRFRGKFITVFIVLILLAPGFKAYPNLWQTVSGFWAKAFLVWLAILALMLISIPAQMGEPGDQGG